MTWADLAVVAIVILAAIGGYAQGFLRGMVRLLVLVAAGLAGWLLVLPLADRPTLSQAVVWAIGGLAVITAAIAVVAWLVLRAMPRAVHRNVWNQTLGIIPAVVQALLVLTVGLALAERLAPEQSTQALLRNGVITGPLLIPGDLIEQMLIGG